MNIGTLFEKTARRYNDKTALIYRDVPLSYNDLDMRANRLAAAMEQLGIGRCERVGILCCNRTEFFELLLACAKAGVIATLLNWRLADAELAEIIDKSGARLIFTDMPERGCFNGSAPARAFQLCSIENTEGDSLCYEELLASQPAAPREIRSGGEDIFLQIYTSGTSGTAKGVMLSHRAVYLHALQNIKDCAWDDSETYLCVLPLFHASCSGPLNTLLSGGTVVIQEQFRISDYLEAIRKHKVSTLSLVPTMLHSLLNAPELKACDLSSVTKIIYGASPIPLPVLEQAVTVLDCDFYQLYGMTETAPTLTLLRPDDHRLDGSEVKLRRLSSAGQPVPGVELRIVSTTGEVLPTLDLGEIITRCPWVMSGYQDLPQETAAVMVEGWYHTRDLGFLDEDGYLHVVGRLSDIIVSGGENISAREVENCIFSLRDDVADVAVIALPDREWGEIVCAVVVRREDSQITREEIVDYCRQNIAGYKKPRRVIFVDAIPTSPAGKPQKTLLRRRYCSQPEKPPFSRT